MKSKICLYCHKEYLVKQSEYEQREYCSRICKKNDHYEHRCCPICKKDFYLKKSIKKKCCSIACANKVRNKNKLNKRINQSESEKLIQLKKRYEKNVIKKCKNDCWGWKGSISAKGYSRFYFFDKTISGHRASWILNYGFIPENQFICHHCDNPTCTNPYHLFIGTPKDNFQDMVNKGRRYIPKGEQLFITKLNRKKVNEIRNMLKNKIKPGKIAKLFQVSYGTIRDIAIGKTWKHISNKSI